MKFIRRIFLILACVFILLTILPENKKVTVPWPGKSRTFTINPLSIDLTVFGYRIHREFKTQLGLDLKGGVHLVYDADTTKLKAQDVEDAMSAARDIVERRVNYFGVAEPSVKTLTEGSQHRIVVDLPGVTDVEQAVSLIGQTAELTFRPQTEPPSEELATQAAGLVFFDATPALVGSDIKKAAVTYDQQTGSPQVQLQFNDAGKKKFADVTSKNVGKQVGIFLDQQVISAPVVQQAIRDGNAVISGQFTVDEAKNLALAINSGALPVPIKLVEQRQVGPSLGAVEIQKSVFAGMVGLAAVAVFMIAYYGWLGVIATIGLCIYAALSFFVFRAIPITLTLSGVAGFLLSVGMAVDSNILIFERIKEEKRKGKDHATAIRLGFGRAIDAIKDANITTIAVAFILFNPLDWNFLPQFGLVRGFALTLIIGVGMSLFTGVFITKRLINALYKH